MSNLEEMIKNYIPRKSCKGCKHNENGDLSMDKCLVFECEDRCDDEKICLDDIEFFYNKGRADAID